MTPNYRFIRRILTIFIILTFLPRFDGLPNTTNNDSREEVSRDVEEFIEITHELSTSEPPTILNRTETVKSVSCGKSPFVNRNKTGEQCLAEATAEHIDGNRQGFCPKTWDNYICWSSTAPDTNASEPCSKLNCLWDEGSATRYCSKTGKWDLFTNYSVCLAHIIKNEPPHMGWIKLIKAISTVGYSVSLTTLFISFSILISFRRLRYSKNILHLHLFGSFMLRATVVLVGQWFLTGQVMHTIELHQKGFAWCRMFYLVWHYFVASNYSWIFMEGLYLHNLMISALARDPSAIKIYIYLGWGLPLVCVLSWMILRASFSDIGCWSPMTTSWIYWVSIRGPVIVSNFINFVFFIRVLKIVVEKMGSTINPESMQYKRLARSTFSLVAVFGAHYFILSVLSFFNNDMIELTYLILDQALGSFQGFFVAIVYCFMNREVRKELKKLYYKSKGESYPIASHSTVISHTKTYLSRGGRTSLHSIHSDTTEIRSRTAMRTPSPQMPRSFHDDIPSIKKSITPITNQSPVNSSRSDTPDMTELLQCKTSTSYIGIETIELVPCTVPSNADSGLQKLNPRGTLREEEIPLLLLQETSLKNNKSEVLKPMDSNLNVKSEKFVSVNVGNDVNSKPPKTILVKHNNSISPSTEDNESIL